MSELSRLRAAESCLARTRHGHARKGESGWSPEWRAWQSMRNRCGKTNRHPHYANIKICSRWDLFENFLEDMGNKPSPSHSLDRIDNSRGYEPGNCRWATAKEQCRNKSNNILIDIGGVTRTMVEWSEVYGINYKTLKARIRKGWDPERAVTTPSRYKTPYR